MEVPIYLSFEEFQSQFKIDFVQISSDNTNTSLIEYYKDLKTRYENVLHNFENARIDLQYLKEKIVIRRKNQLSDKTFDINSEKLSIEIQQFNDTYKLPLEINIIGININKLEIFLNQTIQETNKIIALLLFEITKQPKQLQSDELETEPLTKKQVQKIGLLIRSGIIDYLRQKNPNIKDNQIAGFISLISDGTMKKESINPNLKKENKNYPIKNQQDKNDLDYILKKYGISPQSE